MSWMKTESPNGSRFLCTVCIIGIRINIRYLCYAFCHCMIYVSLQSMESKWPFSWLEKTGVRAPNQRTNGLQVCKLYLRNGVQYANIYMDIYAYTYTYVDTMYHVYLYIHVYIFNINRYMHKHSRGSVQDFHSTFFSAKKKPSGPWTLSSKANSELGRDASWTILIGEWTTNSGLAFRVNGFHLHQNHGKRFSIWRKHVSKLQGSLKIHLLPARLHIFLDKSRRVFQVSDLYLYL